MVYTVTLNPALDYCLTVAHKSDDVHIAEKAVVTYGGKGINVSVVLKRLGIENKAIGFYGGFSGGKLKTLFANCQKSRMGIISFCRAVCRVRWAALRTNDCSTALNQKT